MQRPSPSSLLALLASVGALLATRFSRPLVAIDSSFLPKLALAVSYRDEAGTENVAAELLWNNFSELVYLARKGDPQAIQIVQQLLLRDAPPGACCCYGSVLQSAVFADFDMPPGFMSQLGQLEPEEQARILSRLDYIFRHSPDAGYEEWIERRARYLADQPAVSGIYQRPDFESPPDNAQPETPVADTGSD